jgi:ABC-type transport system involved in multi-copper enzyme maturation permease subunit
MRTFQPVRVQLNPIIVKELRSRMRGVRPYAVLTIFLLVLTGLGYALYQIVANQARFGMAVISAQVGQTLFAGLALAEIVLVVLLSPAASAGAISGEREQLTYDMLLATPLRPASILWGKLFAALAYVLLLIFAAVPLFSVVLIFGGVAPTDLARALALLLVSALAFGTVGLFFSALSRRSAAATVLSYGLTLLLIGGSFFVAALWSSYSGQQAPPWLHYLNPLVALASAVFPSAQMGFGGPMPVPPMVVEAMPMGYGGGLSLFGILAASITYYGPNGPVIAPVYRATLVLYPLITLLLCWLASHLLRVRGRWRLGWGDLGFALALTAALFGVLATRWWWLVWPELPAAMG